MVIMAQTCVLGSGFTEQVDREHPKINKVEERNVGQKERCTYR